MKTEQHRLLFKSSCAEPSVEIDTETNAAYVRFKHGKVARTVLRPSRRMHIAIDLDRSEEVLGVEIVGATEFSIQKLLNLARVEAPRLDLTRVHYRATPPSRPLQPAHP